MGYCILTATTDGSGAATGTSDDNYGSGVSGILLGVGIDVPAGAPGTAHVKIEETNGLKRTLLDATVGATDQVYYPVISQHNISGAAVAGSNVPFQLDGALLKMTISAGGATKAYTATLMVL